VNHYEVLGVAPTATAEDVRRAYLRLARLHHPDFHAGGSAGERAEADRRMRQINEAWAVLGDDRRRRRYDVEEKLRGALPGDEPGDVFVPFDITDDGPDPRDAPDVPYRPAPVTTRRRLLSLAPAVVFGASVVTGAVGMVVSGPGLLALALILFGISCLLFLVIPLLALSEARRDEG
jgi:hypothetical protein